MNDLQGRWDKEIQSGDRFEFGANWTSFLRLLTDDRIRSAEDSLKDMLQVERLDGKRFLDAGSGSGLFSLAARRLGANVTSFDYDAQSVACTKELRRRYCADDEQWGIDQGSVLDPDYLGSLGKFDVVYSWGVLHHTGAMWQALENIVSSVGPGGTLFISIYNDQGATTRMWTRVKHAYVRAPRPLKGVVFGIALIPFWGPPGLRKLFSRGGVSALRRDAQEQPRGMDLWHDAWDWVGGYPFEVAKPEQIFDFYRARGLDLSRLKTCGGGLGCNEFVFARRPAIQRT